MNDLPFVNKNLDLVKQNSYYFAGKYLCIK